MQIIAVSTGLNIYMGWARVSFNPREGPTWPASWQCRSCPGRGGRPSRWGGLACSLCPPLCHCPSRSSVMTRVKIWWTRMTWLDLEVPGYKWKPGWKDTEYTDSYILMLDMATYPRIQCFRESRSHHTNLPVFLPLWLLSLRGNERDELTISSVFSESGAQLGRQPR